MNAKKRQEVWYWMAMLSLFGGLTLACEPKKKEKSLC